MSTKRVGTIECPQMMEEGCPEVYRIIELVCYTFP